MTGRHRADRPAEAPTVPMPAVGSSPAGAGNGPAGRPDRSGLAERLLARLWPGRQERTARLDAEADDWLRALRTGGTRTGRRISRTLRERGLMLAKRAGRQTRRLRAALAREGRA